VPPAADSATRPASDTDAMLPRPFRVVARRQDTVDTATLDLEPVDGPGLRFTPGQFTMLGRLGVGEVPISISGDPAVSTLRHTIRDVGGVTHALVAAEVGDVLDVRGPFGTGWEVADGAGGDVVVVTGGIGLAPLRPALLQLVATRDRYRNVVLLYGARSPADRLYPDELERWADQGVDVLTTVDHGTAEWKGRVGLVTSLIPKAEVDPQRTLALLCGPEVMMRMVTQGLLDGGFAASRIRWSMERNMKCGVGLCGHCQLRELFICVDGPVLDYPTLAPLVATREL
jgi:NAD(P)H-flavin reductase